MTPAEMIRDYADKRGMRYKFFAEMIGISYPALWKYLRKGGHPGKMVAHRIEQVTNGELKAKDLMRKK